MHSSLCEYCLVHTSGKFVLFLIHKVRVLLSCNTESGEPAIRDSNFFLQPRSHFVMFTLYLNAISI